MCVSDSDLYTIPTDEMQNKLQDFGEILLFTSEPLKANAWIVDRQDVRLLAEIRDQSEVKIGKPFAIQMRNAKLSKDSVA